MSATVGVAKNPCGRQSTLSGQCSGHCSLKVRTTDPVGPSMMSTRPSMVPITMSLRPSPVRSTMVGDDSIADRPTDIDQISLRPGSVYASSWPSRLPTTRSARPSPVTSAMAGVENASVVPVVM
jgi:hypothetical protein